MRKNLYKGVLFIVLAMIFTVSFYKSVNAQNQPNLGFEYNTLKFWNCYRDTTFALPMTNAAGTANATITGIPAGRRTAAVPGLYTAGYLQARNGPFIGYIRTTSLNQKNDPYGNYPVVCPYQGAGKHSVKLGSDSVNEISTFDGSVLTYGRSTAQGITYNIHIPANNQKYKIVYYYAIDLESPSNHSCAEMPFFEAEAFDSITKVAVAPCSNFGLNICDAISNDTTKWGAWNKSNVLHDVSGDGKELDTIYYMKWTPATIIAKNLGGRTVTLRFTSAGCTLGAHFGYAYVDLDTSAQAINGDTLRYCPHDTCFTYTPPPGYKTYQVSDSFRTASGKDTSYSIANITPVISNPTIQLCGKNMPKPNSIMKVVLIPEAGFGCIDTLFYYIDTFPIHILPPIVSPSDSICAGNSMTLTNATSPGVWISDSTQFGTIVAGSGVFSGVNNGIDTIKFEAKNKYGCVDTAFKVLYVGGLKVFQITGRNGVCLNDTINLSDSTVGGTWASSNTTTATITQGGVVTGLQYGTVNITYSYNNTIGCKVSVTKPLQVGMPPLTPIKGNKSFCSGGADTLSNATAGGTWISTNPSIATINNIGILTGLTSGTDTVKYVYDFGSCSDSVLFPVYVSLAIAPAITGNTQVCQNNTIQLNDSVTGGSWISTLPNIATVSTLGLVTGVSAGVDSIKYVVVTPTGCAASTTIGITVQKVTLPPIFGKNGVCVSDTIHLSDSLTGGIWYSSNNNATITQTGIVTGIKFGQVTISYAYTSPLGCKDSITKTLQIGIPPLTPINGSNVLCTTHTDTLSNIAVGGTWISTNTTVATISTAGVVTGITAGADTIKYYYPFAGCVDSINFPITVNTIIIPAITGANQVCQYHTIQLSDKSAGGTWISLYPNVATINQQGVVTGVLAGIDSIKFISNSANGCVDSVYYVVTVNPAPVVGKITGSAGVCIGKTATYTDTTAGGVWISTDTIVATIDATGILTAKLPGTTTIKYVVTNQYGCSDSTSFNVIINPNPVTSPISGGSAFCTKVISQVTDAIGGGVWSSTNTSIASINSSTGIFTTLQLGNDTIRYTLTTIYGCIDSVEKVIVVNPTPVVSPIFSTKQTLCVGDTLILSDAVAGGVWSSVKPSSIIVDASSGVATAVASGYSPISYIITNTFGCSDTAILNLIANPIPPYDPITGNLSICTGTSTYLNNFVTGGVWSSTDTNVVTVNKIGLITGKTADSAYINYVVTRNGCSSKDRAKVYVNSSPVIAPFKGSTAVCLNQSINLSTISTGGTWQTVTPRYLSIDSLGNVTGLEAGVGIIKYTLYNANGCFSVLYDTIIINNKPTIAAITGRRDVCIGNQITLSTSPAGGIWSVTNNSIASIDPTGTIMGIKNGSDTAVYTYTDNNTCAGSVMYSFNVDAPPVISSITGSTSLCIGTQTALTDTIPKKGIWISSDTTTVLITYQGIALGIKAGTATIRYIVTSKQGCTNETDTLVTVNPLPVVNTTSGPSLVCKNSTIQLLNNSVDAGVWSVTDNTVATISTTGVFTGLMAGIDTAVYTIIDNLGCTNKNKYQVIVNPLPTVDPVQGNSLPFCKDDSIKLYDNTQGGVWTSLTPAYATINTSTGLLIGINAGIALVKYTVTSGYGCIDSVKGYATIKGKAIVDFRIPTNICLPDGVGTFYSTPTVLPANPNPVSYVWDFGDASNPALAYTSIAIHRFTTVKDYNIKLTVKANGCTSDTTILMPSSYIHPQPSAQYLTIPSPPEVCVGSSITFADNSTVPGSTINKSIWYLGDNSIDTAPVLNYQYAYPSTYWAYHRIIDGHGCLSDSIGFLVTIDSFPLLDAGPVRYILVGDSAVLSPTVSGNIISYNWSPSNAFLNNYNIASPVCTPLQDTTYLVSVTGYGGCTTKDSLKVIALADLHMPNAFSPDNNGIHDTWDVLELHKFPNVDVKIFDRMGQLVFSSTGSYVAWNGRLNQTGGLVPVGVYYYIVKRGYNLPLLSGSVTVFR